MFDMLLLSRRSSGLSLCQTTTLGQRTLSRLLVSPRALVRQYSTPRRNNDVQILEVGPRDGLQNIKQSVPTAIKIELIERLLDAGLRSVEATSFVSPKWVPQLADGAQVMKEILRTSSHHRGHVEFPVLVPNLKGLENARAADATEVVVFASATESFSKANQNCTVDEAILQAERVAKKALELGMKVRGVTSCIFSDPFSSKPTPPKEVSRLVQRFLDMGCYEVGLGDTLGVGTPKDTQKLLDVLLQDIPAQKLAGHFHDTYGQGIANIVRAYDMGIRKFDSSVAGLGGCPYAPGASGNVATEDVVYTLEKSGINTGVDLEKLVATGKWISDQVGIRYGSRAGAALASKTCKTSVKEKPATSTQVRCWDVLEDTGEYRVSRSGTAMRVTLTRSKNGNALTDAMLEGLTKLFKNLANDSSIYHVVIESEGKYFCTGMDLSGDTNTSDMSGESDYYSKVTALYDAIDHAPQTTIALVNGPCFGGGVGLAFVCDVRLVSSQARWGLTEVKIGVSPAIISKYLVREWGVSIAREAMLSGREIMPDEMLRSGAIHSIASDGQSLNAKLDEYLHQLERCAPRSAATNKELVRLGWCAPESKAQASSVRKTFGEMMAPGSEGEHGIRNFQNKVKEFSWRDFWGDRELWGRSKI
ncbi:hypothetical protein CDV31_012271 [Fusarium ambrosium]|uniref:hydroxymethylglutaryl-CoA lyase n=1 Tax=Fusarium ambrosium TaxID=131363 RepID=A0A428TB48_9HYPO|nr:hypothetical protein CDV31_012271 [Fusarium ambrosium]